MSLFKEHKVLVCAGSGGVGKTTLSAALALKAAEEGLKVLVLTIDPAKRLATSLGLEPGADEVEVSPGRFKGQLFASLIDSKKEFDEFLQENTSQAEVVEKIKKNNLYRQLSTTLSGSQEFTSIVKLHKSVQSGKYDLVVLDTPPTQHAIDFLTAPQKLRDLFQGKITRWFIGDEKQGFFSQLLNRSTKTVLGVLKKLTGSSFMEELADFFISLREIEEQISKNTESAHQLLLDKKTGFILVTSFDQSKIIEAKEFYQLLKEGGYRVKKIIVNRAYPQWVKKEQDWTEESYSWMTPQTRAFYEKIKNFYIQKARVYDSLESDYQSEVHVVKVPEFDHDVYGLEGLVGISKEIHLAQKH